MMVSRLTGGCSRILMVGVALACAAMLSLLVASSASAATTLHFFSKQVSSTFRGPNGQPLNPNAVPTVGDSFDSTDLLYVGNHKHHAKTWSASDHLVCTFTALTGPMSGTATCDGQIAIGGSMLLAENVPLTFSGSPTVVVRLTGGTGKFRGAHGHVTSTDIGNTNNSDVTITYSG
jgi:hypothetical protein